MINFDNPPTMGSLLIRPNNMCIFLGMGVYGWVVFDGRGIVSIPRYIVERYITCISYCI